MAAGRCPYLHEEIIFKVLLLVPVVSLVCAKSVCKLWRCIISSPHFIQTHLSNSLTKQPSLMWVETDNIYNQIKYIDDTREYTVRLDPSLAFPEIDVSMNPCSRIIKDLFVSTCNGLVSIADSRAYDILLLNPATTQMKTLPRCQNKSPIVLCLGLGFDSISNDFKLLRIVLERKPCYGWIWEDPNFVLKVNLYSANDDCWKDIEFPETLRFEHCQHLKCVHVQPGMLYMDGTDEILSFDLHNEVFGVYPIHKDDKFLKISNVFDFQGSLAIIFKDKISQGSVSLWTMDDDASGNVCWTKKFNFEVALNIDWVHLYLGFGQFVALNYGLQVIFYDYKKKETKEFPLLASVAGEVVSVVRYTESLVSLEGFQPLKVEVKYLTQQY